MLRRLGYTVGHDGSLRVPLWVSYRLTRKYVEGRQFAPRSRLRWRADPDLPPGDRATDRDYIRSGYSRGHMAMQSDMRGRSEECERQAYLLSNIAPQRQRLNVGAWLALEGRCKRWAKRYGEIWIICGPIFDGPEPRRLQGRRPGRVAIPDGFYKIVVRHDMGRVVVLGFIMRHGADKHTALGAFLASVDDIESLTGLDFLADLDNQIETSIEASKAVELWP